MPELWEFQKQGVTYALAKQRCFIADEMSLGKSVQAIAVLKQSGAYPAVIVCPAIMKPVWERMLAEWLPDVAVQVVNAGEDFDATGQVAVYITNYDILPRYTDKINRFIKPKAIICDESHAIKNKKALRTKAVKAIAKHAWIRLALTGTPIESRPSELVSQLAFLDHLKQFGGEWMFKKRYCGAHKPGCVNWAICECQKSFYGYWDFSGASNLEELHKRLTESCYIRRTKEQVMSQLPELRREIVPVLIDNRADYDKAQEDFIEWMRINRGESAAERAYRAEAIVRMEVLKQLAAQGKLVGAIEWISEAVMAGQKIVVFTVHKSTAKALCDAFEVITPYRIEGDVDVPTRNALINSFQTNPDAKLMVVNIKAGGFGIDLTAASNCVFLELAWTPTAHDQAEARLHRYGQQSAVTAWYLLGLDTIDEQIFQMLNRKRAVIRAAIDGMPIESADMDVELETARAVANVGVEA